MTSDIKKLLDIIEQQLDWGESASWQSRDFENLSGLIFDKTKIQLSESTLRRVWGRVEYKHLPSATTLDTLAQFAGFENWRTFSKRLTDSADEEKPMPKPVGTKLKPGMNTVIIWVFAAVVVAVITGIIIAGKYRGQQDPNNYKFSSQRLTHAIPNSVIFDYDASAAPTDSVFIQQSWDPNTRTPVKKQNHQFTSVYYEPGFYQAKLLVGKKVVKEHKLMIPTSGWLGLVMDKPIPLYLNSKDFLAKDKMDLPAEVIKQKNISMLPRPPYVKYYNIGNFEPVPADNFSYSAYVKNNYREGEAACQFSAVSLITDAGPIIIPLCIKGCVSDVNFISVDTYVFGKTANLSGFGVDWSDWVKVSCHTNGKMIKYYVNDKQVFEFQKPAPGVKIVGLGIGFSGTGSVKGIELKNGDKVAFKEF